MADRHTLEELNNCSREELITIVLMMQGQLDTLNEEHRAADRTGTHSEQLSFRKTHRNAGFHRWSAVLL